MKDDPRQPYYEPIGRLVVRFNDLETFVALLVAGIVKEAPDVAMAMTADMRLLSRLDLLKAIAPLTIRDKALCARLDKLLDEMSECNAERNRIVHSTFMGRADMVVHRYKPTMRQRKGLKAGLMTASIDDIEAVIGKINTSVSHLYAFIGDLQKQGIMRFQLFQDQAEAQPPPA